MNKDNDNFYMRLFKNNWIYILWFIIYFSFTISFLGGGGGGFAVALVLYAISISIALSPLGEVILRFFEKVRPLYTKQEKEFLNPVFQDVYNKVTAKYPKLKAVEMCVVDTIAINACAIGRKTVAVTKGAMETFSEEELKALIAHEFAHILNGDTIATLLTTIGNGIFTVFVLILQGALLLIDYIEKKETNMWKWVRFLVTVFILYIMFISSVIISINSRKNEYIADEFVYNMGYGRDMVEALYLLEKISLGENRHVIARMSSSHPNIAKRIGLLEELIDKEANEDYEMYDF